MKACLQQIQAILYRKSQVFGHRPSTGPWKGSWPPARAGRCHRGCLLQTWPNWSWCYPPRALSSTYLEKALWGVSTSGWSKTKLYLDHIHTPYPIWWVWKWCNYTPSRGKMIINSFRGTLFSDKSIICKWWLVETPACCTRPSHVGCPVLSVLYASSLASADGIRSPLSIAWIPIFICKSANPPLLGIYSNPQNDGKR